MDCKANFAAYVKINMTLRLHEIAGGLGRRPIIWLGVANYLLDKVH